VRLAARALRAVFGTALTAILDTGGIKGTAYNVVLHTREVLYTATTYEYNGVLLEVMSLTRDIGNDLNAVGQTNLGHLSEGRVRLLWRRRIDTGTYTAALGASGKSRRLCVLSLRMAAFPDQLLNRRHVC